MGVCPFEVQVQNFGAKPPRCADRQALSGRMQSRSLQSCGLPEWSKRYLFVQFDLMAQNRIGIRFSQRGQRRLEDGSVSLSLHFASPFTRGRSGLCSFTAGSIQESNSCTLDGQHPPERTPLAVDVEEENPRRTGSQPADTLPSARTPPAARMERSAITSRVAEGLMCPP